jgi:hypothetical protein
MSFYCRLCHEQFAGIPSDWIEFGTRRRGRYRLYKCGDTIHDLMRIPANSANPAPLARVKPAPVEQTELLRAVIGILEKWPLPHQELPKPESITVELEEDQLSETTMARALRNAHLGENS